MDHRIESELTSEVTSEADASAWIFTFADMMTLILTFFVLLYSMSKLEVKKFKAVMSAVQTSFGEYAPAIDELKVSEDKKEQEAESEKKGDKVDQAILEKKRAEKMLQDIQDFIAKKGLGKHIVASVENNNIILRLKDKTLFSSGSGDLNRKAQPILDDIITIVEKYYDFRVRIAGHTDNIPIATVRYPSNWELSAIRATKVLRYLIDGGVDTDRLTATGYGEILPLFPNDNPVNRSQNRRVEFVLEKEK
ncbi:MAG: OmpA family protein [bacterium]|nr:OmpA family protein [bacterium]